MLSDVTQAVLAKGLDGVAMRHRAIADNLANVETPNFTRQEVNFEAQLRAALDAPLAERGPRAADVAGVEPSASHDVRAPYRDNANNVDADREMAALAENTIRYQATLQSMHIRGGMLKTAIHEGRR